MDIDGNLDREVAIFHLTGKGREAAKSDEEK